MKRIYDPIISPNDIVHLLKHFGNIKKAVYFFYRQILIDGYCPKIKKIKIISVPKQPLIFKSIDQLNTARDIAKKNSSDEWGVEIMILKNVRELINAECYECLDNIEKNRWSITVAISNNKGITGSLFNEAFASLEHVRRKIKDEVLT